MFKNDSKLPSLYTDNPKKNQYGTNNPNRDATKQRNVNALRYIWQIQNIGTKSTIFGNISDEIDKKRYAKNDDTGIGIW